MPRGGDLILVLSCNKMKQMRVATEDVIVALTDSSVEVREDGGAVRRPGNAALPTLEAKPTHPKKNSAHAHDGGVVSVFKNIPAEQGWSHVKKALQEKLPPKVGIWFVSEVSPEKNQCFVATAPFNEDQKFFEDLTLDLEGAKVVAEVCHGELLQQALKLLPKHIREKREKELKKKQKEKNKPIIIGTQKFVNVNSLRSRVREIVNSRSDGELLKPDGTDFKLIKALLAYHPKGEHKFAGMTGLKVNMSSQGENRCFWMVKETGTEEDFSAKKCLDAIEANPPYATAEPKEAPAASPAPVAAAGEEPAVA